MAQYHPGKVIGTIKKDADISSADDSIQVIIETWDELVWTVSLDPKLHAENLKEGDVVLADWTPDPQTKAPKMNIAKIIRGKKASEIWELYKEYFERMKSRQQLQSMTQQQYIG